MMRSSLEDICEAAIIELQSANKVMAYMWEEHFGFLKEPEHWKNDYQVIAAQVTAYKMLVDRITDTLLTAYGMAPEYYAADLKLLYEESKRIWPESEENGQSGKEVTPA